MKDSTIEKILVINPGSTSTKIALFEKEKAVFNENIAHTQEELAVYKKINDQLSFRLDMVLSALRRYSYKPEDLSIVMGRGGLLPPVKAGGYNVNEAMLELILSESIPQHASNLGALLAYEIAKIAGVEAYIYDAVSVDEFPPISKVTGMPEIERQSFCHVLNSKAAARKYAEVCGRKYQDMNLIVAHLGGGISISAHKKGKIADSIAEDSGPFAPERSGSIPILYIIDMCFNGAYTRTEMIKKVQGMGGLKAHLGTASCIDIEKMINGGDEHAKLIYDAMAFQIAKGIGNVCPVLEGEIDAIILTGGVAHSNYLTDRIIGYIGFMAPVIVRAGEFEMEALAAGGLRILNGEDTHII